MHFGCFNVKLTSELQQRSLKMTKKKLVDWVLLKKIISATIYTYKQKQKKTKFIIKKGRKKKELY